MLAKNCHLRSKNLSLVERSVAEPRLPVADHFNLLPWDEGNVKVFTPPNTLLKAIQRLIDKFGEIWDTAVHVTDTTPVWYVTQLKL